MTLEGLKSAIGNIGEDIVVTISEKPIISSAVGLGVVGASVIGVTAITKTRRKSKKKTKKKVKKRTKKAISRDRKFRSKQKHELAYVRRKRKLGKKITRPRYKTKKKVGKLYNTKKGQQYKIMASGKARFVKKSKGRRK